MSDARFGIITIAFDRSVSIAERIASLEQLRQTVVSRNDTRGTCDIAVADGTQWEWSHRVADLHGVVSVSYSRPRHIADN